MNLINNTGAPIGEYNAFISAKSPFSGDLILVARVIITISDIVDGIPYSPQLVTYIQKPMQRITDVVVRDSFAYAINSYTTGFNSLYIVDISDYFNPSITGEVVLPGDLSVLTVSGNHAFVSNSDSIQVVDISNPFNPEIVNVIPDYSGYIDSNDTHLFVDMYNDQIEIFDITSISNIYNASSVLFEDMLRSFDVTNDHLYANTWKGAIYGYLAVYDLSDPASPELLAYMHMGGTDTDSVGPTVVEDDKLVFSYSKVFSGWPGDYARNDIFFVDVSDPSNPLVATKMSSWADDPGWMFYTRSLELSNDILYMIAGGFGDGFVVYDVTDLSNPNYLFTTPDIFSIENTSVDGSFGAYKTGNYFRGKGKFGILNLSNLSDIQWKLMIDDYYQAFKVKSKGNYLYFTESKGLGIADISDPEAPFVISEILDGYIGDFEIVQNKIYAVYQTTNWTQTYLASIDITNPANPLVTSDAYIGIFSIVDLEIQDNVAIVTCYGRDTDLKISDISDPANPILVSTIPSDSAQNIQIIDNLLYFTSDDGGFQVIDISDIYNPVVINSIPLEKPNSLDVSGNYAYVTDGVRGSEKFKIIDISDPINLIVVGECNLGYYAKNIVLQNGFAYLAIDSYWEESCVIDVRDPTSPSILSYLEYGDRSRCIAVKDNYAFIACDDYGIQINKLW